MSSCRPIKLRAVSVIGAVGCLAVGACSSGADVEAEPNLADLEAELAECIDDAGQDPSSENFYLRMDEDPGFRSVVDDCAAGMGLTLPDPQEVIRAGDEAVMEEFRCIRDAGWDLIEPVRGEHGGLILDGIDANIPEDQQDEFLADIEACSGSEIPDPPNNG